MSREKQIEEMAKIICGMKNDCDGCMWDKVHCNERNYAEEIYNAGYHKQSEGEWKLGKSGCMYFCSECNYAAHPREVDEWSYCPRCGAKMKERIAHEQEGNAPGE